MKINKLQLSLLNETGKSNVRKLSLSSKLLESIEKSVS